MTDIHKGLDHLKKFDDADLPPGMSPEEGQKIADMTYAIACLINGAQFGIVRNAIMNICAMVIAGGEDNMKDAKAAVDKFADFVKITIEANPDQIGHRADYPDA